MHILQQLWYFLENVSNIPNRPLQYFLNSRDILYPFLFQKHMVNSFDHMTDQLMMPSHLSALLVLFPYPGILGPLSISQFKTSDYRWALKSTAL